MRAGFGLPQALMIILFISGIVLLSIKYARVSVEHYADNYTLEQARLFERSAMERALLEISGHDRSSGCWENGVFESPHGQFDANVTVLAYYLDENSTNPCGALTRPIETKESHGMVRLKVEVQSKGARVSRPVNLVSVSVQRP